MALVVGEAGLGRARHPGGKVGQVEERARAEDGKRAGAVQREEIHAGQSGDAGTNVSTEIEFRERRGRWDGNGLIADDASTDVIHPERDDADVRFAIKGIDFEPGRKEVLNRGAWYRPMGEQQVVPTLAQSPRTAGQRIGPMGGRCEDVFKLELRGGFHAWCSILIGP